MTWKVLRGDCVDVMAGMPDASVDAVCTDPPYGLEFMGKDWDRIGPARGRADLAPSADSTAPVKSTFKDGVGTRVGAPKKNPRCRRCSRLKFDHLPRKCQCEAPDWDTRTAEYAREMQTWHEAWAREALRVLKPGGHLLAFGGTRTYHRLACAIEDAGFEIRDCIAWMYGSGFPKSLDVSKAIDKAAACPACGGKGYTRPFIGTGNPQTRPCDRCGGTGKATRQVVGRRTDGRYAYEFNGTANRPTGAAAGTEDAERIGGFVSDKAEITAPATPEAERWDGWGTALKPAHEPIVVARKPLSGTVSSTVLEHGTGALNIDGCRLAFKGEGDKATAKPGGRATAKAGALAGGVQHDGERAEFEAVQGAGRWPANVVLSHHEACTRVGTRRVKGASGWSQTGSRASENRAMAGPNQERAPKPDAHTDSDGLETVEAWDCHPECPIGQLGEPGRFFATFSECGDESSRAESTSAGASQEAGRSIPSSPTDGYGSRPTDRSLTDTRSITTTATPSTTTSSTSGSSQPPNTTTFISGNERTTEPLMESNNGDASDATNTDLSPTSNAAALARIRATARPARANTSGHGEKPTASITTPITATTELDGIAVADRGFYTAKASSAERNAGLDGFEESERRTLATDRGPGPGSPNGQTAVPARNVHPTVKPIDLMRWLVRLVTPPGGTVLDPFCGSGTTGCAVMLENKRFAPPGAAERSASGVQRQVSPGEGGAASVAPPPGFQFIGIERESGYADIAEARIRWWEQHPDGVKLVKALEADRERKALREQGQDALF